jgi:hypothetical protein
VRTVLVETSSRLLDSFGEGEGKMTR